MDFQKFVEITKIRFETGEKRVPEVKLYVLITWMETEPIIS